MDIVAERTARKETKSEVQSSLKPSPVAGDAATKRPSAKHAPPSAKPSPPPCNPILRSAKHAPPPANPKLKAPKLKASDVTYADQGDDSGSEEGDGSSSEEEGDEEEDEKKEEDKGDDEEDAIVKDEKYKEEKEKVSEEEEEEEEDVKVEGNKRGRKGNGEVMMSKGKKIKVEDKEVGEKKRKKDSELSSSEDKKPLKKKTKGRKKGKGLSKPTKKVISDNQIKREKFLSEYPPLLSRTIPSSFFHAIRDAKVNMKSFIEDIGFSARLGHLNVKTMNKLVRHNLVRGLPTKSFDNDHTCTACLKGKQHKASCKSKLVNSVTKPLHTLHMDLFGPISVRSISHKWYCLVVTDDFSRFTWTFFLRSKDETSDILKKFITEIENLKDYKVKIIRVLVNKSQNKTPYELFNGRTPAVGFLKPFGCHVMILNTLDNLWKFEAKGDEGYFIEYSMSSKAFRVFNKRTRRVEENLHVEF
nr:ribonuclease H-like domain-containing protein [Tanacetum cinerariifolium]